MGVAMKKYLFSLIFSVVLYAENPVSFSALGDVVYNDIAKFEQLKALASMRDYIPLIDRYIEAAEKSKTMGFAVDTKKPSVTAKAYLDELRTLSTEHDTIVSGARERFEEAIQDEDGETVSAMITIGIIDPQVYSTQLIQYYEEFSEEQNLTVIEPLYRDYEHTLTVDQNRSKSDNTEISSKEALLKRMRATEKARSEALERSVSEEREREKQKVMNEQKKELGIK